MTEVRGATYEYLARFFSGLFREVENTESVGTSAVALLTEDSERIAVAIVNLSANTVYVAPTPQVSATRGISLSPNGGALTFNLFQDASLPARPWFAVASGAGSDVYTLITRRDVVQRDPTARQPRSETT